jgi:hypothetical protein
VPKGGISNLNFSGSDVESFMPSFKSSYPATNVRNCPFLQDGRRLPGNLRSLLPRSEHANGRFGG